MHNVIMEHAERLLKKGKTADEVINLIGNLPYIEFYEAAADPIYTGLRHGLPRLLHYLRDGDRQIARAIDAVWGPPDRRYRAASYLAYELGRTVAAEMPEPGPEITALLGLHGRALRTAAEIRLLVMSGFEAAAYARWRSLHELAVVAYVIHEADSSIAERYLAYSTVERWRDMQEYQRHAERLAREPFTDTEVQAAKNAFDSVIATYGETMSKANGWAAPLFPSRSEPAKPRNIQYRELETLAGLGHFRPFYKRGSHHVHAGAYGAELNLTRSPTGALRITTGAVVTADFAEVFHGAAISVEQISATLFAACLNVKEDVERPVELIICMLTMQRFVREVGELCSRAYAAARDRGWVDHG